MTKPTGGRTFVAETDEGVISAAGELGDELRLQYVLGFAPAQSGDGRFHRVQVAVAGCACRARTREGFIASKPAK